jgi:hypothetical protein
VEARAIKIYNHTHLRTILGAARVGRPLGFGQGGFNRRGSFGPKAELSQPADRGGYMFALPVEGRVTGLLGYSRNRIFAGLKRCRDGRDRELLSPSDKGKTDVRLIGQPVAVVAGEYDDSFVRDFELQYRIVSPPACKPSLACQSFASMLVTPMPR